MTDFVCHVKEELDEETREDWRKACEGLDFYREHEGKRYCVLHFPGEDKKEDFRKALDEKFKDGNCNFTAVYFPENQSFESRIFGSKANFSKATFRGNVDFYRAFFKEDANFEEATFHGEANFFAASFKGNISFIGATFKGAAIFWRAKFNRDACFNKAKFLERARFSARARYKAFNLKREVNFDYVEIEKPELCAFNSLRLRPSWFIYVENIQEFKFHEVQWYGLREGPKPREQDEAKAFREELAALRSREERGCQHPEKKNIKQPYQLLARTYRRLSRNYEDNREYPIANEFHYWSMNALRLGSWTVLYEALLKEEVQEEVRRDIKQGQQRDARFKDLWPPNALDVRALFRKDTWNHIRCRRRFGLVNSLYWALSGYGVRAARAFWVLATIAIVFAVLYMVVGHPSLRVLPIEGIWQDLWDAWQAVMYSLGVLARLSPEPEPKVMGLFQILVTIEGILGPLQIALLALAIRRKVMR